MNCLSLISGVIVMVIKSTTFNLHLRHNPQKGSHVWYCKPGQKLGRS